MATLKVAAMAWFTGTLVAPFAGAVERTMGGMGGATLVNVHT
jgi:hypothetical protein